MSTSPHSKPSSSSPARTVRDDFAREFLPTDAEHYQSYLKLKAESDFNEMSYVDKRKKDKAFGKMVKTVLKDRRK